MVNAYLTTMSRIILVEPRSMPCGSGFNPEVQSREIIKMTFPSYLHMQPFFASYAKPKGKISLKFAHFLKFSISFLKEAGSLAGAASKFQSRDCIKMMLLRNTKSQSLYSHF
jgi:hypothetical protein